MEDWQVKAGRIECTGSAPNSRVHVLTSVINESNGEINVSAQVGLIRPAENTKNGSAGFSIGVKDEIDPDVKAACYYGKGVKAGVSYQRSFIYWRSGKTLPAPFDYSDFHLVVKGSRKNGATELIVTCQSKDGATTQLTYQTQEDIAGLVALVSNFEEKGGDAFWFNKVNLSGSKLVAKPENSFGPILWAMHTLSKGTLTIAAQMPPLGAKDTKEVELQLKKGNSWAKAATQKIDEVAYTAHFRLPNWDSGKEVFYRLIYKNGGKEYTYTGTIRQEPLNRPLRFGGLTCQEWGVSI